MSIADQLKGQMDLINDARSKVPVVNYALAVAALSACASIVILFVGKTKFAIISIALVLLGAVLLFIFSRVAAAGGRSGMLAGQVLIWSVLFFFVAFLGLTISAFAIGTPCTWAKVVGASEGCSPNRLVQQRSCPSLEGSAWRAIDRGVFCEDAREIANEMIGRCPDPGRNYNTMGAAHYCLGNSQLALYSWNKAIEYDPKTRRYRRNKGAALIRLKRFSEAEQIYESLYIEYRNEGKFDTSTTYNYALALLLNNKPSASKSTFAELRGVPTHRVKSRLGIAIADVVAGQCRITSELREELADIVVLEPSLILIARGQLPAGETANQFEPYIWILKSVCSEQNPFEIQEQ